MKRYEQFNIISPKKESAEIQSFGMIIAEIQNQLSDEYDINIDLSWWQNKHENQVNWLNEEIKWIKMSSKC